MKGKKYRLTLSKKGSDTAIREIRFNKRGFVACLCAAALLAIAAVYCLVAFTPVRRTIPGFPSEESREQAIANAVKIDSMKNAIERWELYATNLSRVLRGDSRIKTDSIVSGVAGVRFLSDKEPGELARQDSLLKGLVSTEERFAIGDRDERGLPIEGIHFFPPVNGVTSEVFDPEIHPGLDISAPENSVVCAVLDGTVISSRWNDSDGYNIIVQHSGDIISIYRHNEKILVNTGDKIKAGTPLAVAGGIESMKGEHFLHFELWYKGEAVDPAKYIKF